MAQKLHHDNSNARGPQVIARPNDDLRQNLRRLGHNRVVMTRGFTELIGDTRQLSSFHWHAELLRVVRDYDDFSPDNDPYGEHDLGVLDFEGAHCFWKIDCYDNTLTGGSEDAADSAGTARMLTILLAEEY